MNILHYSLGLPPYRRGGLTKYCLDLAMIQKKNGHNVSIIWPGELGVLKRKQTEIKRRESVIFKNTKIENYEIIGGLPVSLLEGIRVPDDFCSRTSAVCFKAFISMFKPDVVHFHTLMGFPIEFLYVLNDAGIKTLLTTHDYYGLCPRTTFIRSDNQVCEYEKEYLPCEYCNLNATSTFKLKFLQSHLYMALKDSALIKILRKKHFNYENNTAKAFTISNTDFSKSELHNQNEFINLRLHYVKMLQMIDHIHFNSNNTKKIYMHFFIPQKYSVVNITHSEISDNRKQRKVHYPIHISYLGPPTKHKGYYQLKETCTTLWNENYEFKLIVYFPEEGSNIISHPAYQYKDLPSVMDEADIIVVPSIWNETFGFIVLEALAYGIPVLVSECVGAVDLLRGNDYGLVIHSVEELRQALKKIIANPQHIFNWNKNICESFVPTTLDMHYMDILNLYKGLGNDGIGKNDCYFERKQS